MRGHLKRYTRDKNIGARVRGEQSSCTSGKSNGIAKTVSGARRNVEQVGHDCQTSPIGRERRGRRRPSEPGGTASAEWLRGGLSSGDRRRVRREHGYSRHTHAQTHTSEPLISRKTRQLQRGTIAPVEGQQSPPPITSSTRDDSLAKSCLPLDALRLDSRRFHQELKKSRHGDFSSGVAAHEAAEPSVSFLPSLPASIASPPSIQAITRRARTCK